MGWLLGSSELSYRPGSAACVPTASCCLLACDSNFGPVRSGFISFSCPIGSRLLIDQFAAGSLLVRAAVSFTAIVPSGVLMGFGFPMGMVVNAIDSRPTPWFWAVNGAAGVLAAGIAVLVSIHATISITLWCGAACYLLLAPIAINLSRLRRNEPDVVAVSAASG